MNCAKVQGQTVRGALPRIRRDPVRRPPRPAPMHGAAIEVTCEVVVKDGRQSALQLLDAAEIGSVSEKPVSADRSGNATFACRNRAVQNRSLRYLGNTRKNTLKSACSFFVMTFFDSGHAFAEVLCEFQKVREVDQAVPVQIEGGIIGAEGLSECDEVAESDLAVIVEVGLGIYGDNDGRS